MEHAGARPRLRTSRAFLHPAAPGGAPLWATVVNALFAVLTIGIFRFWWAIPIPIVVQLAFAWVTRQGPYHLRYVWRALVRPILYLDT
jgi:hypothetical protein